jgi:hypothetical protein
MLLEKLAYMCTSPAIAIFLLDGLVSNNYDSHTDLHTERNGAINMFSEKWQKFGSGY